MLRRRCSKIRFLVGSLVAGLAVAATGTASASSWFINVDAPAAALEDFHRDFAAAVYPYPGHGAKPLGLVGFEVYVDASYSHEFGSFEGPLGAIGGNLPGGVLSVARIGVHKGLPLGID